MAESLDLQRAALRAAGVADAVNLYHDLASGVRDDRPGLDSLPARPAEGRRARGLEWVCGCSPAQGAQIDTTTAAGRLVFGIFGALAEFGELIRERTVAGPRWRTATRRCPRCAVSTGREPGRGTRHRTLARLPRCDQVLRGGAWG